MFKSLMLKGPILVIIVLSLLLAACSGTTVSASAVKSVASQLNCTCGSCDLILSECTCETAGKLTSTIEKGLSRGQSAEQIIQDLVRQYGQRVLVEKPQS